MHQLKSRVPLNSCSEEEIKGCTALIIDDLVATAASLVEASNALKKAGAKDIYAAITHPVLSGSAVKRIEASHIKKLFVTNTISVEDGKRHEKIEVLSIAPLLAEAIKRIHNEESVSCLFD